jgi:hypothetical protein
MKSSIIRYPGVTAGYEMRASLVEGAFWDDLQQMAKLRYRMRSFPIRVASRCSLSHIDRKSGEKAQHIVNPTITRKPKKS